MHQLMPIDQILSRASAIGLAHSDLARQAGLAYSTLQRARDKGRCRTETLRLLGEALIARELQVRERLNHLHPEPEHGHGEAE